MATGKKSSVNASAAAKPKKAAADSYKIESGIKKPKPTAAAVSGKSRERLTMEKLKVGQSFAVSDTSKRRRISDIAYTMNRAVGKAFSVIAVDTGLRVWRDK